MILTVALFVADTNNNQVVEVPVGGGRQTTIASGLFHPNSAAVDRHGNVYVVDREAVEEVLRG